jgi:GrpB-like predicted nucleotidyltransferase (UPF0157 family)
MARRIEVVPYNPEWPCLFQAEATRLAEALADEIVAIHHMGSTAIPGLQAKPTLDLLLVVRAIERIDAFNDAMIALGYQPRGENGIPGRRYYVRHAEGAHTHHLHAYQRGHPDIERHLRFRDYLRAHPGEAKAYGALKERLAQQYPADGRRYTEGKDALVAAIDRRAAAWAGASEGTEVGRVS